ncbi:MAG TPA: metal-dependent hydrolase [Thermoanaerobaculia bacterium]|jgi:inner membrane protein
MPSAFSHAAAALGIGAAFFGRDVPARVLGLGALCAAAPDLDVIGFRFGIHYGDLLGHRGLTHSLLFAAILAALAAPLARKEGGPPLARLWTYLFLATASHGLLDALTDGGLGVAFFAPFHDARYFFPFRPIVVSPIGIGRFFSGRGLEVIKSELIWVWLPSAVLAGTALGFRRTRAD